MKNLSDLGIIMGDISPLNVSKFIAACLNNKLSTEAIQAFILASKGGLENIDQALKMNIATNNELNDKSMAQISQIMESSSGKELSSALLIQQLIQINSVVAAQKHTQMMNLLSVALKVVGVLLVIYLVYSLVSTIINWIGIILLIIIIGGLILFGLSRS
ncbi:MAG: hypothetical protein V8T55_03450 [Phocaeicola plebeius]|jgi:hypothetical protein|uniref:hypothetical protein n=1 Tax=Phocaeicola plebeius TaxID=310297 RepID=UPI0026372A8E|nr:hypothetical protein [Phocaeicola plebeius]